MINKDFEIYMDKEVLRQEQLLEILIKEDRWYQLCDLSEELGWSKKTISKDITYLNEILPKDWNVLSYKGRGILLLKPLGASLTDILYIVRRKTKIFNIFECILSSKCSSILALSKKIYLPYSAVKEVLKHLESHLHNNGLRLEKSPLTIKGPELALREYILKFNLNIYIQQWPFTNYVQQEVQKYLTIFEKQLDISLFPWDKHCLSMHLCITINRIKKRNSIGIFIPHEEVALIQNTTFYEAFSKVIPYIEKEHSISFFIKESVYFTIQLMGARYCYNNKTRSKQILAKRIREKENHIHYKVLTFTSSIEKKTGISLWNDDEFLFQLSLCFYRTVHHFKMRMSHITISNSTNIDSPLVEMVRQNYRNTFDIVKEEFKLIFEGYEGTIHNEEIGIITLYIEAREILQKIKPAKVLLYVAENQGVYNFICAWLKKNFQNQIEIFSSSLRHIKKTQCDIIVTNTSVDIITSIPIVRISQLPTMRDKKVIQDLIKGI